jgi:hypothetical protein
MVRRMLIRTISLPARRGNIWIARDSVADLDFSSMIARLPMRISALRLSGDPNAIPGLCGYCSGVKLAFNVLLFEGKGQRGR